jgi:hypothetical protein
LYRGNPAKKTSGFLTDQHVAILKLGSAIGPVEDEGVGRPPHESRLRRINDNRIIGQHDIAVVLVGVLVGSPAIAPGKAHAEKTDEKDREQGGGGRWMRVASHVG